MLRRVNRGGIDIGVDEAHATSRFDDALQFANDSDPVGQVKEESFGAGSVEEAVRTGDGASIGDSKFELGPVTGAALGDFDHGRADVDPRDETRWAGLVRNRKRRSSNPLAKIQDFVTNNQVHAFVVFSPNSFDFVMVIKEFEEVDEVRWRNVWLREVCQFRHVSVCPQLCAKGITLETHRKPMFGGLCDVSPSSLLPLRAKYLGCKQQFRQAVNDRLGIEPAV